MRQATLFSALLFSITGCHGGAGQNACNPNDLEHRAYIVSRDSDEVHVIDLNCMEVTGVSHTGGQALHMLELDPTLQYAFVDSSETNETVVVDVRTLQVTRRLQTGSHPTHATLSHDGRYLAVVLEGDDAVAFIDAHTREMVKKLPGFKTPHFVRFAPDGHFAYVANINGNHLTQVNLDSLEITGEVALDGKEQPVSEEGGFADAQIDQVSGVLYAAHAQTGRVLVYDTVAQKKLAELAVGKRPWIVYAEHPFATVSRRHLVPNFGDQSASILNASAPGVLKTLAVADDESYGVNYSPLAPHEAFVMNRNKKEIAVVNTDDMKLAERIPVGGTTETASTTADGKYIVATVSSINQVVVIDAATHKVVKTFTLGKYPWSVTIPNGQNYCH